VQPARIVTPAAARSAHRSSPLAVFDSLWANRQLVWQLTKREVLGRYRGSLFGLVWSLANPLLMLAVYTLVFGYVFAARWAGAVDSTGGFALVLFTGLTVFNLFSECITRAPGLVVGNPNYVKKVVFPLECLAWVTLGAALFHAAVSFAVLLAATLVVRGALPWTVVLLPLVLLPLLLLILGLTWILAALGVYVRDTSHVIGVLVSVLLFLSPVFYPASALPEPLHGVLLLNPLAIVLESARAILVWGTPPDWPGLAACTLAAGAVAWLGLLWFDRTRYGFADVL
jgi:lipopolysaccharide transport system permease protein